MIDLAAKFVQEVIERARNEATAKMNSETLVTNKPLHSQFIMPLPVFYLLQIFIQPQFAMLFSAIRTENSLHLRLRFKKHQKDMHADLQY